MNVPSVNPQLRKILRGVATDVVFQYVPMTDVPFYNADFYYDDEYDNEQSKKEMSTEEARALWNSLVKRGFNRL